MKKIALDLDGVVFDSENLFRVFAEMHDVDKYGCDNLIDNSPRMFQKRYNWPEAELKGYYKEIAGTVLTSARLMTGVEIVLKKLMGSFEFIVVTSRSDEETKIAIDRLQEVGLSNIQIFNNEHSKIDRLISEKCDYIIDDDIDICKNAASKGITGVYFRNGAAEFVQDETNFKMVNNWGEIYKYLMLGVGD